MKYLIHFSQSDAMAEYASEHDEEIFLDPFTLESEAFVQITYEGLRSGPDGDDLAFFDEVWWAVIGRTTRQDNLPISKNNRGKFLTLGPFSDIVIEAKI